MQKTLRQYSPTNTMLIAANLLLLVFLAALPLAHSKANPAQGILGTITRPGFLPTALALDELRNRLYVFDQSTQSVFIFNATTFQELGSVPTTLTICYSMVLDESLGKLYAGFGGPGITLQNNIAVIDVTGGSVLSYLSSAGYNMLTNDEDLDLVYVSYSGAVAQIDAATDSITTITGILGNLYTTMAVNPQTHELFVANYSQNNNNLFIVNPSNLATTIIPNLNGFGVGINWTENKAYISYCHGGTGVCIYDRDTGISSGFVETENDSTEALVFNPMVNRLYSNTEVNRVVTIFDGASDQFTSVNLNRSLPTVDVRYSTDNVYLASQTGTYVMSGATAEIVAQFPVSATCSMCLSAVEINQTSGYVYVINETSTGIVTIIQDEDFTPYLPPKAFRKLTPANLTTGLSTSPTLSWESSDRAISYEYCYDTTNDDNCSGCVSTTNTSVTLNGLNFGTLYNWHVRALNNNGTTYSNGDASEFWMFGTGDTPGEFNKITPPNSATNLSASLTLSWGPSSGAHSYEICYDTTDDSACSIWTNIGSSTSKSLSGLSPDTTYYWHVRSKRFFETTYSNGSSTAFWSFTTGNIPGAFSKTGPANGATGVANNPSISWGDSTGAASYAYCYDTTNDNACSSWTSNGNATSKALSGLSSSMTYYWHVRASNSFGTTYSNGSTTAFWSFSPGDGFQLVFLPLILK